MSAITATATEITERVRNEGEKQLQRLEEFTHPQRARSRAKRRAFGKLTLLVMVVGVAYAIYRAMQTASDDAAPVVHDHDSAVPQNDTAPVQRLAKAAL